MLKNKGPVWEKHNDKWRVAEYDNPNTDKFILNTRNGDDKFELKGKGTEDNDILNEVHESFIEYYSEVMNNILKLRIQSLNVIKETIKVLKPHYYHDDRRTDTNKLVTSLGEILLHQSIKVLVPYNIINEHWVGFVFAKDSENISIKYIDPENNNCPDIIIKEITDHLKNNYECQVTFERISVEQQKYSNCGSEVIENFMLYLTGERLSQEEAIQYNSLLVEQQLTSTTLSGLCLLSSYDGVEA